MFEVVGEHREADALLRAIPDEAWIGRSMLELVHPDDVAFMAPPMPAAAMHEWFNRWGEDWRQVQPALPQMTV
jgi:hypothetical protein